tara:strand:- start:11022 stop:11612 length:591 start_codon:yes stop_codon:yes gene_type:complete
MRTITTTKTVFTFDELSEEAKETAIEKNYDINTDYEWHEFIYEDAKTIGELMGINIDRIYFSGFASQGDGACFEGSYSYEKGSVKSVTEHAPKDQELHRIAQELQQLQQKHFYGLTAHVKQSGHYCHANCTQINVDSEYTPTNEDFEDEIQELLKDYMNWIYSQLEKEYDYQTSEEAIKETIEANEYEFTEDGKQA